MNKFDLINKKFVKSFYFDTINCDRKAEQYDVSFGRERIIYGENQPVFIVGVLHEVENTQTNKVSYLLLVGLSKCDTNDLNFTKKNEYYNKAEANAYSCPIVMFQNIESMNDSLFENIANVIVNTSKLEFMMTPEEIALENDIYENIELDQYCELYTKRNHEDACCNCCCDCNCCK